MIPLKDQINAILSAPIPFFFVCGVAVVAAWAAMEWLYKARRKKIKELYKLSTEEMEIRREKAERIEDELAKQVNDHKENVESLSNEVESLRKRPDEEVLASLTQKILSINQSVLALQEKLGELAQARAAVSHVLSPGSATISLEGTRSGFGAAESSSQRR